MEVSSGKKSQTGLSSCWSRMEKSFSRYSEESMIHSISYIGKTNLHWIERVFWILTFLLSLSACSFLIYKTWQKWDDDPVLVTFNERSTPTWKIPFPAITICPESRTNIDKFNLTEMIQMNIENDKALSDDDETALEALSQMCEFESFDPRDPKKTHGNYVKKLREVQNGFADISKVTVLNRVFNFREYFHEIFTDEGFCYTFNMLDEKDLFNPCVTKYLRFPKVPKRSTWNVFGYDSLDPFVYPRRALGSGLPAGISITLAMRKKDAVYSCKNTNGFRITFHTPDEMPKPREQFYRIPFDVETLINIQPSKMSTSDNLREYKPDKRECYFRGEKRLQFFKHYNLANCKLECFTNFTLNVCKCVKYSMPNSHGTRICPTDACVRRQERNWIILDLSEKMFDGSKSNDNLTKADMTDRINDTFGGNDEVSQVDEEFQNSAEEKNDFIDEVTKKAFESCNCLPACSSILYDTEISQTRVNMEKHKKATESFNTGDDELLYSLISIYFKGDQFIEAKRSELYGWFNFLSSCGGFLGLLLGGSLLSLIEILYHLTIRKIFEETHNKAKSED